MIFLRQSDSDADRKQQTEVVENSLARRGHGGKIQQVGLPQAQQQPGDRKHRDGQHQCAANPLQTGEYLFHGVTRGLARLRPDPKPTAGSARAPPRRFRAPALPSQATCIPQR